MDTYKHKGMRRQLVSKIREKGIQDERILDAINKVPRHEFMDSSFLSFSYEDKPFPIGSGQTISQPYTVAFQTELLAVEPRDKILEIGTGSGYQACVLYELGARVFTIERQRNLYLKTKKQLDQLGYYPKIFYGDGYKGLPQYAPFDKILITAAAPEIPSELLSQLRIGGLMVVPVGKGTQIMTRITKKSDDDWITEEFGYFSFVPMVSDKASDE